MDSRILVVSNEALTEQSSNGRTLLNFLKEIPAENVAQFCLRGTPEADRCAAFYRVSDKDALNALLMKRKGAANQVAESRTDPSQPREKRRSCKNLCLRDLVWRSYRWWDKAFTAFLDDFAPTVLLFQAGDAPFMFEIAMRIARRCRIPIVMYNSENYVLKYKLFSGANPNSIWHWALKSSLRHSYKHIMGRVSYCIYSTEYLENCYQQAYPHPGKSTTFYTVSDLQPLPAGDEAGDFTLLYCGNLGVGRVPPLCEMAQVLHETDPRARLEVYGKFLNQEEQDRLCANPNVSYGGMVPYSQIPELMRNASMLIHCENTDRFENLKGAFSTKIADSLACGRPFLVYADRAFPFVQYLMKHDCAHVAATSEELKTVLQRCVADQSYRFRYVQRALETARENHSTYSSCEKMEAILTHVESKQ